MGKFLTPLPDVVPNRPTLVVHCIPARESLRGRERSWPEILSTSASIGKNLLKKILRGRTFAVTADDTRGSHVAMQLDILDPSEQRRDL